MKHRLITLLASAAMAALLPLGASAQESWPDKTVTLIVNFPPGGSTDQVARALGNKLGSTLKQSFVVDNRAGATGTIGANAAARAPADGSTFLVSSLGPLVIVPHLLPSIPYDPLSDFTPLTVAVKSPNVLVVPSDSPFHSVKDLVAHLKANPGTTSFASAGSGSSDHLTAELFWLKTKTSGVHVPYRGGGPAHADLMGSQVDASFQNINAVIGYINAGRMRPLAITSEQRSALLPDVPTLAEEGVNDVVVTSWQAVLAPKNLPPEIKAKAHAAVVEALKDPAVSTPFTSLGFEIVANTPEEFAAFMQQEHARWKSVVQEGGIRLE